MTSNARRAGPKGRPAKPAYKCVSMTGFGRGSAGRGGLAVDVEIKSYNSRYVDFVCKLPRDYTDFEFELKAEVTKIIQRGRVEVTLSRVLKADQAFQVQFNKDLFAAYVQSYKQSLGLKDLSSEMLRDILNRSEVLGTTGPKANPTSEKALVFTAVRAALNELDSMRRKEGERLAQDMSQRLNNLTSLGEKIRKYGAHTPEKIRTRLQARLEALAPNVKVDEGRLAQELVYAVDRLDFAEEIVRLESHLQQCAESLSGVSQGKRLEFLLQELGREFNTIGSKAQDASIQNWVVEAKSELERLREQVQNIE